MQRSNKIGMAGMPISGALTDAVGTLKKLETLLVQHNRLQVLPSTVANMAALRDINVSHNQLLDFPVSLCGLRNLNSVDLSSNRIRKVPEAVKGLQAVELNLNQNQVSVKIILKNTLFGNTCFYWIEQEKRRTESDVLRVLTWLTNKSSFNSRIETL